MHKTENERIEIVDEFYKRYEVQVAIDPHNFNYTIEYAFLHVEKVM